MAKGFKHGGSSPLNFKVVGGTTAPENPKENTIWINTSTAITDWVFSATQPTNPTEGMVWITTSNTSPTAFNALKKNDIQVYPLYAKQYVSGAFVDVTTKSYRGGEWVNWLPEGAIYYWGNECEDITGGWVCEADYSYYKPAIFTKKDSGLNLTADSDNIYFGRIRPQNKIDLTGKSKLYISVDVSSGFAVMKIFADTNVAGKTEFTAQTEFYGSGTIELNISGLQTFAYVGFIGLNPTDWKRYSNVTIREVRVV